MKFKNRHRNNKFYLDDNEEILVLWILRILLPLSGHREFISKDGFYNDEVILALKIDHLASEDDTFDKDKALSELKKMHAMMEAKSQSIHPPVILQKNTETLAKVIGLTVVDCRIFEFVVLMHAHSVLNEAMDFVKKGSPARLFTILAVVLDIPKEAIKKSLSSEGQLARSGLVTMNFWHNSLTNIFEIVSSHMPIRMLSQSDNPLSLLRDVINPCSHPSLTQADFPHLDKVTNILIPYMTQSVLARKNGVNILITGAPGTGKSQFARIIAKMLNCDLFEIASEDVDGDPLDGERRLKSLRVSQSVLKGQRALLLFDEVEDIFGQQQSMFSHLSMARRHKGWLNKSLEDNPVPTFWLSNSIEHIDPAVIRRFGMVFEIPIPPRTQRHRMLQQLCPELLSPDLITRVAELEYLAPAIISKALDVVQTVHAVSPDIDVDGSFGLLISNTLTAQGHQPLKMVDSTRLPEWYDPSFINTERDLNALAEGLKTRLSGRICLYGPPGTGKTAYGRWLALYLDKPLIVKKGSDLISKWVGDTEKNIARAFREAESDQALLLIDEVDSFLQDRRQAQNSWEVTGVNEMLTQMESFSGIFIASTNLMHGIDQAALRRFDLKLKFDYLIPEQAWRMFVQQCNALGLGDPDEDLRHLIKGLTVLTPGDFAAVTRQHRFSPFTSHQALVTALAKECEVKEERSRHTIGFIQ